MSSRRLLITISGFDGFLLPVCICGQEKSYLRKSDRLYVWFYGGVFGVGGSNDTISSWTKFSKYVEENNARGVIRLVTI